MRGVLREHVLAKSERLLDDRVNRDWHRDFARRSCVGNEIAREAQMVLLERTGSDVLLEANNDVTVLLLSGAPIDEPIVGHGPFVMNTEDEIREAITDFNAGRFGRMPNTHTRQH